MASSLALLVGRTVDQGKLARMADVGGDDGIQDMFEHAQDAAGALVVRLRGEIDMSNAERLGDALEAVIDPDTDLLILDLAGLEFMDSSGIAMLLRVCADIDSVSVRHPSSVVRRIIESTGLGDILRIET